MADVSCSKGLIFKRNEDGSYAPFFVKVREDDISWGSTAGDSSGTTNASDYDSLLEYFLDILANYVTIDEVTDWENVTPSSVNVTFTSPVKAYNGETVSDAIWTVTIDSNYAFTAITKIPVSLDTFALDETNNCLDFAIDGSTTSIRFPISSIQDNCNLQLSFLCHEDENDNVLARSILSSGLVATTTNGTALYEAFNIKMLNHVYTLTEDVVTDAAYEEDGDDPQCYISITIVGKGYNDDILHAGTYTLNSSTIRTTSGLNGSNILSADDDGVYVSEPYGSYISFIIADDCSTVGISYTYRPTIDAIYIVNDDGTFTKRDNTVIIDEEIGLSAVAVLITTPPSTVGGTGTSSIATTAFYYLEPGVEYAIFAQEGYEQMQLLSMTVS